MKIRYYFLLITFFILGYLYSCKKDFARHADVITGSVDVVMAIAHGRLTDLGSKPISEHGFVWDSISTPGITGKKLQLGGLQNTGDFQGKLPNLLPNKTYYFKAFIIYNQEAFYGDMVSFTTPELPTLTTLAISEISQSTAKSGGNITNDGGAPITAYGVCWSITASPDLTGFHTIDGTGTGTYTSNLTSLAANTIYHVRAYATNNYGTRYGNEVVFNTGQSSTSPIVNTTDVSGITQTAAQSGGEVVSDGGSPVTQRGVCWNSTPYPTTSNNHSSDGSGTGIFTSSITALTAGTTYYLRAFAINSVGTSYGSEKSFMTLSAPGFPSVTTAAVTNITASTATSGGVVLNDGGVTVTQRGVCWSTNPNPTTTDSHTSDGSGVGSFTSSVTGLTSTITYHIRAYAINSTGTAYGNEISFTAGQNLTSPTVTTTEVVNILQTTATCGGNVTSDGGATVTLRGICWSTSTNPTTSDSKTQDGSGTGGYLSSMTGLTANTTYHVRAYAVNSVGTSYGNEKVFTTLTEPTPPFVSTAPVTNVTNTSAISGGTVTSDGGASVTARGVCWSTSANPTITNSHTADGTGTGGFVSNVTGLNGNTTYYLRAYATN